METRQEMKARHDKELIELKARQRHEHQSLKIKFLGIQYGLVPPTVPKNIHKAFGIPSEFLEADTIYKRSLETHSIDNDNKYYGITTGRFSSGFYQIQSMSRSERILQDEVLTTMDFGESPKCECGAHKVSGSNCSARMHSTWCPLHGDS